MTNAKEAGRRLTFALSDGAELGMQACSSGGPAENIFWTVCRTLQEGYQAN